MLLSIAPMIDWTYIHFRVFMSILAPNSIRYTEMQSVNAIINQPARALAKHKLEGDVALQVGGSEITTLVKSALLAEEYGFSEININCGCPSPRVIKGAFGASLMTKPKEVAAAIAAMKAAVNIPITVKMRIGVDEHDSFEFFSEFAESVTHAGSNKLIVHARKAWLNGISPKKNRTLPPLKYDYVYQLKQKLNHIPIILNGGITNTEQMVEHLKYVDGVMFGRLAYENPYETAKIHHYLFPQLPLISRAQALNKYWEYLQTYGHSLSSLSLALKPIMQLAHGQPNANSFKTILMEIQKTGDLQKMEEAVQWFT